MIFASLILSSLQTYSKLEKSITILLTDYEIKSLKEIKKYMTKWNIREQDYGNIILTDAMEIELPKFEKYKNGSTLDPWFKFIYDSKVIDMSNKEIKKAKKVLEEISKDGKERYLAELREKYIMDQKAIEDAGYDKGLNDGIEKEKIEIAKRMKEQGIDTEKIKDITGLTIEEINNL